MKILTKEEDRPTAKEVLSHSWFNSASNTQFSSKALMKLTEFSSSTKIRQIIYFFIAYRCNHD